MFTKISILGLLLLQWTTGTNAFVAPTPRGFRATGRVAGETPTTAMFAKKILLSFESTGNGEVVSNEGYDPDMRYTNVLRLHVLAGGSLNLEKDPTGVEGSDQICLYVNGVGGDTSLPVPKKIDDLVEHMNLGVGILKGQICSMTTKLEEVYEKGDQLYVIGFSRGSASARQFVANLDNHGLKTSSGEKVDKPPIEFLGCFDTVSDQFLKDFPEGLKLLHTDKEILSSDVIGEKHGQLPGIVKKAVHNLSLDDNRQQGFTKERMYERVFCPKKKLAVWDLAPFPPIHMDCTDPRVHEVWFPGNHEDVGGSKVEHGISDISGKYMQEWLEQEGIVFYSPDEIPEDRFDLGNANTFGKELTVDADMIRFKPDPGAETHIKYTTNNRPVATVHNNSVVEEGTVRIHESVLEHLKATASYIDQINKNIVNNEEHKELVVVGSLDTVDQEKTKELKYKLKEHFD